MKILVLFDIAQRADPEEKFTPESLREYQKPTEASVLDSLQRLGHQVETLAVFDNVTTIVEKLLGRGHEGRALAKREHELVELTPHRA